MAIWLLFVGVVAWGAPQATLSLERSRVMCHEGVGVEINYALGKDAGRSSRLEVHFLPHLGAMKLSDEQRYDESKGVVGKSFWLLFPRKAGVFNIAPQIEALIVSRKDEELGIDKKDTQIGSKAVRYSLPLSPSLLHVAPVEANLTGQMTLSATINRSDFFPGSPRFLTVTIEGWGNLHEAPPLTLTIPGVQVLTAPPIQEMAWREGRYQGRVLFRYTLNAHASYTIPPLSITYYDLLTGRLKNATTAPLSVTMRPRPLVSVSQEKRIGAQTIANQEQRLTWVMGLFWIILGGLLLWIARRLTPKSLRKIRWPLSARGQLQQLLGALDKPERYEAALEVWQTRRALGYRRWRALWKQSDSQQECAIL
ncbi:MAG: BatD family protein [Campylobacterales bacterium]